MLKLVAIPIGNSKDISARGLEALKSAEVIILEERKEGTSFLRAHGITHKDYRQLNEHSTADDVAELVALCSEKDVALISDCGTPGFCDPGADLVRECRKKKIPVQSLPGASSLMTLLSLSSKRLNEFFFKGFLPLETEHRATYWKKLASDSQTIILMDTPYRLQKTLQEWKTYAPQKVGLLGLDLTHETELVLEGTAEEILKHTLPNKAEFLILMYGKS
jgi:16S rRNA (cytidine1402-2'-O)-methyltransferase